VGERERSRQLRNLIFSPRLPVPPSPRPSVPFSRSFDRLKYLEITGAAAEIAGELFFDLIARRLRIAIEELFRREKKSRCAVSALRRAQIGECFLQGMKPSALSQSLNRGNLAPFQIETEREAGKDRSPIDKHSACAAFAELAAVFRAGQPEVLAQNLQECFVRQTGDFDLFAVDPELEMFFSPSPTYTFFRIRRNYFARFSPVHEYAL
jgi:hypothetical protein